PSASAVSTRNVGSCRGTSLMTRIVRAPVYAGKARSAVRQQVRVPLGDEPGYLAQRLGRLVLAVLALGQAVEQRHRIGAQFGLGGGAPDHGRGQPVLPPVHLGEEVVEFRVPHALALPSAVRGKRPGNASWVTRAGRCGDTWETHACRCRCPPTGR